jgi:anti-anti-sigma regulatory factor
MGTHMSTDQFAAAPVVKLTARRLGERTSVIHLGTELRHIELPVVDEAVCRVLHDGCHDLVFDLTLLRRYEAFALVRLAREWDRLAASGCVIHVAAREPRVRADLERLVGTVGWELHSSTAGALRALLSAPIE